VSVQTLYVEISSWFGELESTFYKYLKSPHLDAFSVSNDPIEGCTGKVTSSMCDREEKDKIEKIQIFKVISCLPFDA
jgi:hypothetical protein